MNKPKSDPMNEPSRQVESLLEQMSLAVPSESMDDRVEALLVTHSDAEPELATAAASHHGLWWTILGLATAASLLTILMNLPIANSSEVSAFKQLHGHSTNLKYVDCSDCHSFGNKQEEVIDKWMPNGDLHAKFDSNCQFCHDVEAEEKLEGGGHHDLKHGLNPVEPEPEQAIPFGEWHGHSRHAEFLKCASCHVGAEKAELPLKRPDLPKAHADPELNCALCHVSPNEGAGTFDYAP